MLLLTLSYLLGGVGLFLVGMILMSDGLRSAAGSALQHILERSTGTTLRAFLSGLGLTALVQSSSATTLTSIGFVSAGLLSFSSALGVIVGANVGTTSTGWIVSLLGFKLNVGQLALPFIGVGALLRLLFDGRRAHLGMALAGFGLIFIGIDVLQEGMGGLAQRIDLSSFPATTLPSRLLLILIGMVMTVLVQSSSAAVALTLTALNSQAIDLEQSAFLVIGQNLGTTVTAVLAAVGASVPARRAAMGHILFNAVTGLLAFASVRLLLLLVAFLGNARGGLDPATALALFHTVFNLMGAFLFLPILHPFARLLTRLVPDRGPPLTRHLDRTLLRIPSVALEAAARTLNEIAAVALTESAGLLAARSLTRGGREKLWAAEAAMKETAGFLGQIRVSSDGHDLYTRRLSLLHARDHLERLIEACLESETPIQDGEIQDAASRLTPELEAAVAWLRGQQGEAGDLVRHLAEASARQAEARRRYRVRLLEETAAGQIDPEETHRLLESMRWVDRVGYHAWRTVYHLATSPAPGSTIDSEVYDEAESELTMPDTRHAAKAR
ncbi:MAG: Na/Pi cotransporter family protein [Anaerolineae bacterium]